MGKVAPRAQPLRISSGTRAKQGFLPLYPLPVLFSARQSIQKINHSTISPITHSTIPKINLHTRYERQIKLPEVGLAGQQRLAGARVLIVGLGGLGCPVAQYLVAAGVGHLGLMDPDRVDLSNLHRQVLYTEADAGQPKAEVARAALQRLNAEAQLAAIPKALSVDNAVPLFRSYDLVIDGTDNFQAKYLINDAALKADKPWVYGSLYRHQGQLSVFNHQGGPTYRCLFPTATTRDISCEATGVLGVLPGVVGTLQATEALKLILGIGAPLSGRLKVLDLLGQQEQTLAFGREEAQVQRILDQPLRLEALRCELASPETFYLDVREPHEQPQPQGGQVLCIPLGQLAQRHHEVPQDRPVHVVCQSGQRSQQAIRLLRDSHGFQNLINVPEGIHSILK